MTETIRQAIQDSGKSLSVIGQETGIGHGPLSRFMRAERTLNLATAERLVEYLALELRPARQR